jgi:hypothetical protein
LAAKVPFSGPKTLSPVDLAEAEMSFWKTYDESEADENYDFYSDLDLSPIKGY